MQAGADSQQSSRCSGLEIDPSWAAPRSIHGRWSAIRVMLFLPGARRCVFSSLNQQQADEPLGYTDAFDAAESLEEHIGEFYAGSRWTGMRSGNQSYVRSASVCSC